VKGIVVVETNFEHIMHQQHKLPFSPFFFQTHDFISFSTHHQSQVIIQIHRLTKKVKNPPKKKKKQNPQSRGRPAADRWQQGPGAPHAAAAVRHSGSA
jgi:hypothetical protein